MDKIEKLIEEIGVDCIVNYISNRKVDSTKEIKEFILSEIQSCKIQFCDDGYFLVKDGYKLFKFNFRYGYFFYDHDKIYEVLIEKYKTNSVEIFKIIKDILVNNLKYDELTPSPFLM
jgi:hypothetical protein